MAENKEMFLDKEIGNKTEPKKITPELVDIQRNREAVVPREVKSWMEKIENDDTNTDDQQQNTTKGDDDSILKPIAPTVKQIILPTDKSTFKTGFGKAISDAGRWLSEFVLRIIKRSKGNVKFKEE